MTDCFRTVRQLVSDQMAWHVTGLREAGSVAAYAAEVLPLCGFEQVEPDRWARQGERMEGIVCNSSDPERVAMVLTAFQFTRTPVGVIFRPCGSGPSSDMKRDMVGECIKLCSHLNAATTGGE